MILPDLSEDSILKIALYNNFFEITVMDNKKKVLISTNRRRGEILEKSLYLKGLNEEIEGDSLYFVRKRNNFIVFFIKNISDLKKKKRLSGLKNMLEKIGKQERIEYLSLESDKEVIFSTKNIAPVQDEKIRERVLKKNEIITRKNLISDEIVLEVLKTFYFQGKPVGILRLGISLDRFRKEIFLLNATNVIIFILILILLVLFWVSLREAKLKDLGNVLINFDYSFYILKGQNPVYVYGKNLNIKKEDIPQNEKIFLLKSGKVFYMGLKEKNYLVFLNVNEILEKIKEEEKEREEKSILRILSSFAHEIKNPLNTLKLIFYKRRENIGKDAEEFEKAILRLSDSVDEFLNLLRPFYIKKEKTKIKEFIEYVISKMSYYFKENDITVTIDGIEKEVEMDKTQMEKVFSNLFENAVEAQPEGGKIEVKIYEENNKLKIHIKDYGIGIKKENIERIFEPYFTTKKEGSGLGLFTVKRILDSHGFKVTVRSEEGKGTEFIIEI